ncbi:hypothetical protein CRE_10143 [Caenorhabditis remanei]|uniref:Uncharacterized protein n=1 Tax=Caenorhabditis remanei TaxID=31234 RepID=E3M6G8_CAERE|nr:hypothetical protein CRE_10143 [Caenorhabditis remanei]
MLSLLFLVSTIIVSASADGYNCAGNYLINPPLDLNEPYYYPEGWREGMEPAKYAGSQMCNWQINVPEGLYATVTFYKNTESESGINCVYPNGQQEYIEDKELNPYIFTTPQFQVNLRVSDKQGEFSFKVVWSTYPPACKINNELTDSGALSAVPSDCVSTYTSPNKVMLIGFTLKDDLDVLLRQSAVYEGDSVNGKYLGNLYYARYQQIMSSTNKLTIYTFGLDKVFNYTLYMGMDSHAVGDVQQFTGMNCPSNPAKDCFITLNAYYNITAIATIGRQPDFLKQFFQFPRESTLKIYEEKISDSNLLATINQSNYLNQFPMEVKTSLKIYHLDTGRLSLPVAKNADDAQYSTVYDGRYVNIHSFDYRRTSYTQDTLETFRTEPNQKMYFKFNVKYFDVNGPTTLDIKITRDGAVVYSDSFTGSHLPPANTLKVFGDNMSVNYQTYGNYTKGFEVDLLTTKNDDVSSPSSPSPSSTLSTVPPSSTTSISTEIVTMSTRTSSSSPPPTSYSSTTSATAKTSLTTSRTSGAQPTTPVTTMTALTHFTIAETPTTGPTDMPGGTTTTAKSPPFVSTTTVGTITGGSTGSTSAITRGTTQRYETTTKSGTNQLDLVPLILVFISILL